MALHLPRSGRARALGVLAIACAALLLGACAGTREPSVPTLLAPPSSEALTMTVAASGVQIYECRAAGSGPDHAWVLLAPEAELRDSRGNVLGHHGAGPRWQSSDGSAIVGTVRQRVDAPDPGAIAWLLLAARADGAAGSFSDVTSVQRVRTVGGVAPTTGCAAETAGARARVPYHADYRFFSAIARERGSR